MDSSFDLFLPNKISKKALASAKSKDNKTSREDDLERALSHSLREATSSSVESKSKRKLCNAPLLLRRTKADRERIISEKVALVLATPEVCLQQNSGDASLELKSGSLRDCVNSEAYLWRLSQQTSTENEEMNKFTLDLIAKYETGGPIDPNSHSELTSSSRLVDDKPEINSDVSTEPPNDSDLNEDGASQVFSPGHSTAPALDLSLFKGSTEIDKSEGSGKAGGSSHDPAECLVPILRMKSDSLGVNLQVTSDISTEPPDDSDAQTVELLDCQPLAEDSGKRKFAEIIDENSDIDNSKIAEKSIILSSDSEISLINTPIHCKNDNWSRSDDIEVLERLREDLKGLVDVTDCYTVHVYLKDDCKFKVPSNILEVRCPSLLKDATKRILLWFDLGLPVCRAFFTYLFSGSIDSVRRLSPGELKQLNCLCVKYGVHLLGKFVKNMSGGSTPLQCFDVDVIDANVNDLSAPLTPMLGKFVQNLAESAPLECLDLVVINTSVNDLSAPLSPVRENPEPSTSQDRQARTIDFNSSVREFQPLIRNSSHSPSPLSEDHLVSPLITNCETPQGRRIVSSAASPLPNYSALLTPELKRELDKYGLKTGLDRRKAITLLNYIYDQIHPFKRDPIVRKAIVDTQRFLQTQSNADSRSESSDSSSCSTDISDKETEEVTGMAIDEKDRILTEIGIFIKNNEEFHLLALKYEPIRLDKLSESLRDKSMRFSRPVLKFALNELGIEYVTEDKDKNRRRRRKIRKR